MKNFDVTCPCPVRYIIALFSYLNTVSCHIYSVHYNELSIIWKLQITERYITHTGQRLERDADYGPVALWNFIENVNILEIALVFFARGGRLYARKELIKTGTERHSRICPNRYTALTYYMKVMFKVSVLWSLFNKRWTLLFLDSPNLWKLLFCRFEIFMQYSCSCNFT